MRERDRGIGSARQEGGRGSAAPYHQRPPDLSPYRFHFIVYIVMSQQDKKFAENRTLSSFYGKVVASKSTGNALASSSPRFGGMVSLGAAPKV